MATAAGFDETAAQLEGFAQLLWVVPFLSRECEDLKLQTWIEGLQAGTDPESPEYWGDLGDFDQWMVEMESLAVVLLAKPDVFLEGMSECAKRNLTRWLSRPERRKGRWIGACRVLGEGKGVILDL